MKYLHIIFNNFFDYQTILELLPRLLPLKLTNPEEFKLSFTPYVYSELSITSYIKILCDPLKITFTTESEECSDE